MFAATLSNCYDSVKLAILRAGRAVFPASTPFPSPFDFLLGISRAPSDFLEL
jgi:hypothetical protein